MALSVISLFIKYFVKISRNLFLIAKIRNMGFNVIHHLHNLKIGSAVFSSFK